MIGDDRRITIEGRDYTDATAEVPRDRLFVNEERTVLVRIWTSGTVEVATRQAPYHTWGPPAYLTEEK